MHYKSHPPFKTKHWRRLYESRILDITALKESANGAAFVIVDAEPWGKDNSEPAEIGLSLLSPAHLHLGCKTMDKFPKTLDAASNFMGLETHWIRLIDRERRERGREQHRYGTQHCVSSDTVEETITGIIESFRDKTSGDAPLILTGFAIVFELQVLSSIYPNLLNYFTSWVDLQEVASGMTGGIVTPGLRETLIACGFEGYRHSQESRTASQHNAATDTVRTAMLLIRFLGLPSGGEMLEISQSSQKTQQFARRRSNAPATPEQKNYWKGSRPRPKEFYPFITRVYRTPGFEDFDGRSLFNLFSEYEPTAVGMSNGNRYGWVCLPNLKTLEKFVRSVHTWEAKDGSVWEVISEYDSTVIPAQNWEELKLRQREESQANDDEKRTQRRLKNESQNDGIWLVNFEDTD
ncbi:uncharacterized protein Triagg1_5018 [Trichoderma aggressivum f. europaeum]|uniref:Uncharacterized protein n=1 Tax=Trichoderma aggressivum f. europaeum TaxID=173218 RepID=A0AAE1M0X6_9HYPO|nr:hypothetical protein Triagg1_5018 [Trichoderma aggressivum f. europaeum]